MRSLKQRGLDQALHEVIQRGTPVLGICLGMQVSLTHSQENDTPTLNIIPGQVRRFAFDRKDLKIPHMGWNNLSLISRSHPVLARIEDGAHAYFVHSYHVNAKNPSEVLAETDHGGPVTAIIGRDNIIGTLFHPEKSQAAGLRIISNFLRWAP